MILYFCKWCDEEKDIFYDDLLFLILMKLFFYLNISLYVGTWQIGLNISLLTMRPEFKSLHGWFGVGVTLQ